MTPRTSYQRLPEVYNNFHIPNLFLSFLPCRLLNCGSCSITFGASPRSAACAPDRSLARIAARPAFCAERLSWRALAFFRARACSLFFLFGIQLLVSRAPSCTSTLKNHLFQDANIRFLIVALNNRSKDYSIHFLVPGFAPLPTETFDEANGQSTADRDNYLSLSTCARRLAFVRQPQPSIQLTYQHLFSWVSFEKARC